MPPGFSVEPGHGHHEWVTFYDPLGVLAWVLLLIGLAAAVTALLLWRAGRLPLRPTSGSRSADEQARHVLAERFARSDISSEEFLERCATLNWTPGIEKPARGKRT